MNKQIICINDTKFKTAAISVNFYRKLNRKEVTFNALLPSVMRQGCEKIPSTYELNCYLGDLFGASLFTDTKKCGDTQIISFLVSTVSDSFEKEELPFEKSIDILNEIIYHPLCINEAFSSKYVETEKKNLKELIESIKNDKREYAKKRVIEEMYKDESFGIFEYGYVSDLEEINERTLYEYYKHFINTSDVKIVVCGNFDKERITEKLEKTFDLATNQNAIPEISHGKFREEVQYVCETAEITQGKLAIGYRTNITKENDLYFAMLVLNNLFGGAPHSKLFTNVREKLSLAYYAGSGYNSFKGLLLVNCGIEFDKYEVTLSEVENQLQKIKDGEITEDEITFSKAALITGYRALSDSLGSVISFYTSQSIGKTRFSPEGFIEKINSVTKSEIISAAQSIKADTVYFLKGEN